MDDLETIKQIIGEHTQSLLELRDLIAKVDKRLTNLQNDTEYDVRYHLDHYHQDEA